MSKYYFTCGITLMHIKYFSLIFLSLLKYHRLRAFLQTGKGPFAPIASGLVKIGETMTLVVTVDGDPGFNILVRECVARDNNPESGNQLQLTDAQGCVAKPKLFGSFQTTTNPATGSLIAYAYFQVRN